MKILLLGGTGAIGESLVKILESRGDEICVTSRSYHEPHTERIHYLQGNAHELRFLKEILKTYYDVIIDFLIYDENELNDRLEILLNKTDQYIFLSSSRVYAEAKTPITEDSPRLLETCSDTEYLLTNEYALSKARQENVLRNSGYSNWTIIRPYITYNVERLQLGVYEKEQWLYRALHGRTIVFSKDIASRLTTLTFGHDVAVVISKLLKNEQALGESIHITTSETMTWEKVMDLYLDVIEDITHKRPNVYLTNDNGCIVNVLNNTYQVKYDRLFDRFFNNNKVSLICGEKIEYTLISCGLQKCLQEFLNGRRNFKKISWKWEAYLDKLTGEKTPLNEIPSWEQKLKYLIYRYTPYFYLINF